MRVLILEEVEYDDKTLHCCDFMTKFLGDPRIQIYYFKKFRGYYLGTTSAGYQEIFYCPFCHAKLPSSLMKKYYVILKKEYNIDDPYDENQEQLVPDEFKTDEWWKQRNL